MAPFGPGPPAALAGSAARHALRCPPDGSAWSPGESSLQHLGRSLVLASLPLLPAPWARGSPGRLEWTRTIAPDEGAFDGLARACGRARPTSSTRSRRACQKKKAYQRDGLRSSAEVPTRTMRRYKYLGYKLDGRRRPGSGRAPQGAP